MPLTELQIRAATATEKPIKLFDGNGLFLLVNPNGSRWWRFKYQFGGKERGISLGMYPEVSLKRARTDRDEARQLLLDGIDPSAQRRAEKLAQKVTLEAIADEWLQLRAGKLAEITLDSGIDMLRRDTKC